MSTEPKPEHKHKLGGPIVTVLTALISAYVAVTIARINAQGEFKKASLGYEKIAESVNKLEEHSKKQDDVDANLLGQMQALNSILQFAFASQSGKKYITVPPADVRTYGEFKPAKDRPPLRTLIARKDKLTRPARAAAIAVEGLKNLQADADAVENNKIKLEPLPAKLENVKGP